MIGKCIEGVHKLNPIVHCISNYVTANSCANILLAVKASPIMADDCDEVEEIVSISSSLCLNIGTLNKRTVESMIRAGKTANKSGKPVVLDPVGIGASRLRTETAKKILSELKVDLVRANISEICALSGINIKSRGVDASIELSDEKKLMSAVETVKKFALVQRCITVATGKVDVVSDGATTYLIYNGSELMKNVTGTGCQLSSLCAAFIASNKDDMLSAAAECVAAMGIAGEIAKKRMKNLDGNASYANYIIDAIFNMNSKQIFEGAKYEILR